ncbi:MAG: MBL fold metallo-hydrolase [Vicinamibacterales bacterium]|nr:MBL fold metallo-hydrolase [Vicinamibacterales bacterium]
MAHLTFLGAARTVTGSKYLLEVDGKRILVDCGLFQGLKDLRLRNWQPLPDAGSIDAVVLTHAHIDHSGMLPRLVAEGFKGRIFCTAGTMDLCSLVLPDAGRLQEEEADRANRGGYSKHHPAKALFTEADANNALTQLQPIGYNRPVPIAPGLEVEFIQAGHLLGSAYARLRRANGQGGSILFGGDLGRYGRPVLPDPAPGVACDTLLVESTYGDRVHAPDDHGAALAEIITDTAARGGKLIIPSFAVGRVEEVLYWIKRLEDAGTIRPLKVYVDSPMALKALAYYQKHAHDLDPDVRPARGEVCSFCTERFIPVASAEESKDVVAADGPAIIISASGMATGGRVLHHLQHGLPDPKNTVLFVGFQAAGTRGRRLIEGEPTVKMFGQWVPVQARIARLNGMSAHADANEILQWLRTFPTPPKATYIVHGEPKAQDALKARITGELGWHAHAPVQDERVEIEF